MSSRIVLRRGVLAALAAALLAVAWSAVAAHAADQAPSRIGITTAAEPGGGPGILIGVTVVRAGGSDRPSGGTVTLAIDGAQRGAGQLGADGTIVFPVGALARGQHRLLVRYGGNGAFEPAEADGVIVVDPPNPPTSPDPSGEIDGPPDNDPYDPHPQGSDPRRSSRVLRASARVPRTAKRRLRIRLSRTLGRSGRSYLVRLTGRGRTVATGSLTGGTLTLLVRRRDGRVPRLDGTYTMRGVGTPKLRTTRLILR